MAASAFQNSSATFRESVALLCTLSDERVTEFCIRLLEALAAGSSGASPFTPEEERAIAKKLKVDSVAPVREAASFIFEQFAYYNVTKEAAYESLEELALEQSKKEAIMEAWGTGGKAYLNHLRSHTLGGPLVLQNVTYDSQLNVASSEDGLVHKPNAVLQLTLKELEGDTQEKVSVRFGHEELYRFFQQIDKIQDQIDNITAGKSEK